MTRGSSLAAGLLATAMLLSACGDDGGVTGTDGGSGADDTGTQTLRFTWWGNEDRAALTEEAIALFEERNPDITVDTTFAAYGSYFDKLATEVAGGNAPDVFQVDGRYLREYAERGTLLDLSSTLGDDIATEQIDEQLLATGSIDDVSFAIPMGQNSSALIYDPAPFEAAGAASPGDGLTWSELFDAASAVAADGTPGITDFGWDEDAFEIWLNQNGSSLYTEDGQLGFEKDDLREYWGLAEQFRQAGASSAPDATAAIDGSAENSPLGRGLAAAEFGFDSTFAGYVATTGSALQLAPFPTDGDSNGQYRRASMFVGVSSQTEHEDAAVALVDFLINDPEAGAILGTTRGLPPNLEIRESVGQTLEGVDAQVYAYEQAIESSLGTAPVVRAQGDGAIQGLIQRLNEDVAFARLSVDDAVDRFFDEAERELS